MMNLLLIDIWSTTVKIYEYNHRDWLKHIQNQSIWFKNSVNSTWYINEEQLNQFIDIIRSLQELYPKHLIKTYATDFFRKLSREAKLQIIDSIYSRTKVYFNIISQDLESFYIQKALIGKYHWSENCLIINIWWWSTELVIMHQNKAIERHNVDFGIMNILNSHGEINKNFSEINIDFLINEITKKLPNIKNDCSVAFYTWWELEYMKRTWYRLTDNTIFQDEDHPSQISVFDFKSQNDRIFFKISMEELRNFMPENPNRMNWARACSAIAQAILWKYNIDTIIPSNSNLINGTIRQEFETVVISWSFRKHFNNVLALKKGFVENWIRVLSPLYHKPLDWSQDFIIFEWEENSDPIEIERRVFHYIEKADALVVCCPWWYIWASALLEVGYAYSLWKKIVYTEQPNDIILHILPSEIGLILDS